MLESIVDDDVIKNLIFRELQDKGNYSVCQDCPKFVKEVTHHTGGTERTQYCDGDGCICEKAHDDFYNHEKDLMNHGYYLEPDYLEGFPMHEYLQSKKGMKFFATLWYWSIISEGDHDKDEEYIKNEIRD